MGKKHKRPAPQFDGEDVERMARALFEQHQGGAIGPDPADTWDNLDRQARCYAYRMAIAAIETMPTP
jgi:hypothetical protein